MLKIKRVPTVVSNYQKDEASDESVGCGRNCLGACCLNGTFLHLKLFDFFCLEFCMFDSSFFPVQVQGFRCTLARNWKNPAPERRL